MGNITATLMTYGADLGGMLGRPGLADGPGRIVAQMVPEAA
jgi:hypothetical protein